VVAQGVAQLGRHQAGIARAVLLVDEAQEISPAALCELCPAVPFVQPDSRPVWASVKTRFGGLPVGRMTFRQQMLRCSNELSARQAQCPGDLQNRREGRHVLATLDFANVAPLDPRQVRQGLLGDPPVCSGRTNGSTEGCC